MTIDIKPSVRRTGLPMMKLIFEGKSRVFILDSGSTVNLISDSVECDKPTKDVASGTSFGYEGKTVEYKVIEGNYELNGKEYAEEFSITSHLTFSVFEKESGLIVDGILGIPFLINHGCVLDFEKGLLHVE